MGQMGHGGNPVGSQDPTGLHLDPPLPTRALNYIRQVSLDLASNTSSFSASSFSVDGNLLPALNHHDELLDVILEQGALPLRRLLRGRPRPQRLGPLLQLDCLLLQRLQRRDVFRDLVLYLTQLLLVEGLHGAVLPFHEHGEALEVVLQDIVTLNEDKEGQRSSKAARSAIISPPKPYSNSPAISSPPPASSSRPPPPPSPSSPVAAVPSPESLGFFVGAITGALIGLANESGLFRGAGIGAISGAVFSIDVVESSLRIWSSPDDSYERRSGILRERRPGTALERPKPPNFQIGWKRTKDINNEKPKGWVIADFLDKLESLMGRRQYGSVELLAKVGGMWRSGRGRQGHRPLVFLLFLRRQRRPKSRRATLTLRACSSPPPSRPAFFFPHP
ncbi:hypothetical protein Taro_020935 [Colocasia esculenta]|uniref:Uncharacterized protein n=1 Tax=Colocasia esculenta TaxID=4460 RepID=A0A843V3J4_COLES|nr:hypothetical protein [Colocasia esculenta]